MDRLIDGIRKGRFVVLGRAGMDMFAEPPGTKAEHAETFRADLGGSSANICAGLCKLEMQSALVTSVSDDTVGRLLTCGSVAARMFPFTVSSVRAVAAASMSGCWMLDAG